MNGVQPSGLRKAIQTADSMHMGRRVFHDLVTVCGWDLGSEAERGMWGHIGM